LESSKRKPLRRLRQKDLKGLKKRERSREGKKYKNGKQQKKKTI